MNSLVKTSLCLLIVSFAGQHFGNAIDTDTQRKGPTKRAALPEQRNTNRGIISAQKNKNFDIYVLYDYVEDSNENPNYKLENEEDLELNKPQLPPVLQRLRHPGKTTAAPKRKSSKIESSEETLSQAIAGIRNESLALTPLLKGITVPGKKKSAISAKTTKNAVSEKNEKTTATGPDETCVTKECTLAAADMLRSMDTSIKPCDDFYQFACGGWLKNNPLEHPIETWSQFHVMEEKLRKEIKDILNKEIQEEDLKPVQMAKTFYKSCLEKEPLKDLPTHLQQLTNKYLSNIDEDVSDPQKFAETLGTLRREFGGDYILSLFVGLDDKDSSQHTIYLDTPTLALERIYHVDLGPENENYMAQIKSIVEYWPQVYPDADMNATAVKKVARDILAFESKIAEITSRPEDLRNETALYNPYAMDDFVNEFGGSDSVVNYKGYLAEVFKDVVENDGVELGDIGERRVIIREKDYFRKINSVLSNAIDNDRSVIGNYLRWRIILDYGIVQSRRLQELGFSKLVSIKRSKLVDLKPSEDRNKFCADLANSYFGMAVTYRSVKEGFTAESYDQVKEMASNIIDGFFNIINNSEWIATDETKEKAKEKSRKMKPFIGYPDWLLNATALENHYKGAEFSKPEDHFQNYFEMSKWDIRNNLKTINSPGDLTKWVRDPMVINAFYHSQGNSFYFPAGILQAPLFYTGDQIQALNYGAIGMVMGHEITHGFDDSGKQRDEDGNLNDWWDDETLENYIKRADCFAKQYSNYEVKELQMENNKVFLNGNLTLDENIADNGGLREAFEGYKSFVEKNGKEKRLPGMEYSPEQLFFLSFAQAWCGAASREEYLADVEIEEHSPYPFRVKGVLDNSQEFAETWNCPVRNPDSCKLW